MRTLPVGTRALLVEVDSVEDVAALHAECVRRRDAGLLTATEIIPAARTVLLDGVDPSALAREIPGWDAPPLVAQQGALVEIPVTFDGPDLGIVASHWSMTRDDAVAALLAAPLRVAFTGFAPGFAYLTGTPGPVPRHAEPRPVVPAGTLALAGDYAGIYPRRSPGGWQLVGTTASSLFDVDREPAALLAPGDRVRLVLA